MLLAKYLSAFCFVIYDSGVLKKINKYFLMLVEFGIIAFTLIYSNNMLSMNLDFTMVFLIAIGVTIAFSDQTSINLLNNKFVYFLGRLGFAIYMNHCYIRIIMINIDWSIGYIPQVLIFTTLSVASSLICMAVMDLAVPKLIKKFTHK